MPVIKSVPNLLGTLPNVIGAHRWVRSKHLWTNFGRNQPVPCNRLIAYQRGSLRLLLFPAPKIHGSGKRRHHHELGEGYARLQCHLDRRIERRRLIGREAEDEGAKHMDAVLLEGLQLLGQSLARVVEVFEDRLESL